MKKRLFSLAIVFVLVLTLTASVFSFAQEILVRPISAPGMILISSKIPHWAQTYVNQLSKQYDIDPVFANKDLNASITADDFRYLVKLILDDQYDGAPDSVSREAVVHELARLWAEKTNHDLDLIPLIKMIFYTDTDQIDQKYFQGVHVAYMKKIAQGNSQRIFAPKSNTTYGELAALLSNTADAVKNESNDGAPMAGILPWPLFTRPFSPANP